MSSNPQRANGGERIAMNSPWTILFIALPPLRSAVTILRSVDPLGTITKEEHSRIGMAVALLAIFLISMLIIIASDGAPFINPWSAIWDWRFSKYFVPGYNWPVLLQCMACALTAYLLGYLLIVLAGRHLCDTPTAQRPAMMLACYAALGIASTFATASLFILALGYALSTIKIYIFTWNWIVSFAFVMLAISTWHVAKIFRRTSIPHRLHLTSALTISVAACLTGITGALSILAILDSASSKHSRIVNSVRNTPTVAVVQVCKKLSSDVVCAITLYPQKWQDYELIGDWKLGTVPNAVDGHQAHSVWHPTRSAEQEFALVQLNARKDITIELRTAANDACSASGTTVTNDDVFFSVQGRVLGEQRLVPQQMRVRLDNADRGFVAMMKRACHERL